MVHEDLECDDLILLIGNGYNEAEVLVRELESVDIRTGIMRTTEKEERQEWKTQTSAVRRTTGQSGKCFLSDGKVGPCGFGEIILAPRGH